MMVAWSTEIMPACGFCALETDWAPLSSRAAAPTATRAVAQRTFADVDLQLVGIVQQALHALQALPRCGSRGIVAGM